MRTAQQYFGIAPQHGTLTALACLRLSKHRLFFTLNVLENVMCEYCEEYRKPLDKQDNFSVWMLGSDMVVRHSFGQTLVPVNFCPMCGKKLEASDDTE